MLSKMQKDFVIMAGGGRLLLSFLAIGLLFLAAANVSAQDIHTVAGNGNPGFGGDGGAATAAQLYNLKGVVRDASGNIYIADYLNNRVRKVDASGIITTVAGTGKPGFSGDGGAATAAQLKNPTMVAFDASGNLYISDMQNFRIRKVDTSGIISTVAGNGTAGFGGDGGPATSAQFLQPSGVAFDASGNLYIADYGSNRIRKVDTSGIVTTVAGNGKAGFSGDGGPAISAQLSVPFCVALDASGNFYIADCGNGRIRKVNTSGIITTVAGNGTAGFSGDGGAATSAQLNSPFGVGLDASGNVYIADSKNHRIRKVDTSGTISTVAGNGKAGFGGDGGAATSAQLNFPFGVAFDGSKGFWIVDLSNHRVRKVVFAGSPKPR